MDPVCEMKNVLSHLSKRNKEIMTEVDRLQHQMRNPRTDNMTIARNIRIYCSNRINVLNTEYGANQIRWECLRVQINVKEGTSTFQAYRIVELVEEKNQGIVWCSRKIREKLRLRSRMKGLEINALSISTCTSYHLKMICRLHEDLTLEYRGITKQLESAQSFAERYQFESMARLHLHEMFYAQGIFCEMENLCDPCSYDAIQGKVSCQRINIESVGPHSFGSSSADPRSDDECRASFAFALHLIITVGTNLVRESFRKNWRDKEKVDWQDSPEYGEQYWAREIQNKNYKRWMQRSILALRSGMSVYWDLSTFNYILLKSSVHPMEDSDDCISSLLDWRHDIAHHDGSPGSMRHITRRMAELQALLKKIARLHVPHMLQDLDRKIGESHETRSMQVDLDILSSQLSEMNLRRKQMQAWNALGQASASSPLERAPLPVCTFTIPYSTRNLDPALRAAAQTISELARIAKTTSAGRSDPAKDEAEADAQSQDGTFERQSGDSESEGETVSHGKLSRAAIYCSGPLSSCPATLQLLEAALAEKLNEKELKLYRRTVSTLRDEAELIELARDLYEDDAPGGSGPSLVEKLRGVLKAGADPEMSQRRVQKLIKSVSDEFKLLRIVEGLLEDGLFSVERAVECASFVVFVRISAFAARFASWALRSDPALRALLRRHGVELLVFEQAPAVAVGSEATRIPRDAFERLREALQGEGSGVSLPGKRVAAAAQDGAGGLGGGGHSPPRFSGATHAGEAARDASRSEAGKVNGDGDVAVGTVAERPMGVAEYEARPPGGIALGRIGVQAHQVDVSLDGLASSAVSAAAQQDNAENDAVMSSGGAGRAAQTEERSDSRVDLRTDEECRGQLYIIHELVFNVGTKLAREAFRRNWREKEGTDWQDTREYGEAYWTRESVVNKTCSRWMIPQVEALRSGNSETWDLSALNCTLLKSCVHPIQDDEQRKCFRGLLEWKNRLVHGTQESSRELTLRLPELRGLLRQIAEMHFDGQVQGTIDPSEEGGLPLAQCTIEDGSREVSSEGLRREGLDLSQTHRNALPADRASVSKKPALVRAVPSHGLNIPSLCHSQWLGWAYFGTSLTGERTSSRMYKEASCGAWEELGCVVEKVGKHSRPEAKKDLLVPFFPRLHSPVSATATVATTAPVPSSAAGGGPSPVAQVGLVCRASVIHGHGDSCAVAAQDDEYGVQPDEVAHHSANIDLEEVPKIALISSYEALSSIKREYSEQLWSERILDEIPDVDLQLSLKLMDGMVFHDPHKQRQRAFEYQLYQEKIQKCLEWASNPGEHLQDVLQRLGVDRLAAIRVWTCVPACYVVTTTLRNPECTFDAMKPLLSFLRLLLSALHSLPERYLFAGSLYRSEVGIQKALERMKSDGTQVQDKFKIFSFFAPTSFSRNPGAITKFKEKAREAQVRRTIYRIKHGVGYLIQDFSAYEAEDEVVIENVSTFKVLKITDVDETLLPQMGECQQGLWLVDLETRPGITLLSGSPVRKLELEFLPLLDTTPAPEWQGFNLELDPFSTDEWMRQYHGDEDDSDELRSRLGKGNFGVVQRMKRLSDGCRFAVKIFDSGDLNRFRRQGVDLAHIEREVKILQAVRHRNVIRYEGVDRTNRKEFRIVMELASGGTIEDVILQLESPLEASVAERLISELMAALEYIHGEGIAHRDVKPANLLLSKELHLGGKLKLADFGLACTVESGCGSQLMSKAGTDTHFSPEKAQGFFYGRGDDVWAAGCVVLELVRGQLLRHSIWHNSDAKRQERENMIREVHERSPRLGDAAAQMLQADRKQRASAAHIVRML